MEQSAEFFREKAAQCRELAASASDDATATLRGLEAMALEFDACALAIDAGTATARVIERDSAPAPSQH